MSESGGVFDRLTWLERAIADTERFCGEIEREAETERTWTRFETADYDFEIDLNHQAVMARQTLALMHDERRSILARRKMREKRQAEEDAGT